jgi:hypothetical protein
MLTVMRHRALEVSIDNQACGRRQLVVHQSRGHDEWCFSVSRPIRVSVLRQVHVIPSVVIPGRQENLLSRTLPPPLQIDTPAHDTQLADAGLGRAHDFPAALPSV